MCLTKRLLFSFTLELFNKTMEKIDNLLSQGRLEDGQYKFLSFMMLLPDISNDDALIITLSMFNDSLSTVRIVYRIIN